MTSNPRLQALPATDSGAGGEVHRLTLDSSQAAPGEASLWVRTLLAECGVAPEWIAGLDLCSVEVVANIVDHAYADQQGEISLRLEVAQSYVSLSFEDNGPPFDPLVREERVLPALLEDAAIGGYGIHLVRHTADEVRYERIGNANRLSVGFGRPPWRPRQIDRRRQQAVNLLIAAEQGAEIGTDRRSGIDRRSLGYISRTELFRNVAYDDLERILAGCRIVSYRAGEVVLAAGQSSGRVWVVIEGILHVHFDSVASDDFIEIVAGECVGEVSAADGKLSTAWVVVAADSRLLEINAEVFLEKLLSISRVGRNLISVLAERMRRSNQRIARRVKVETEFKALQRELEFARRIQYSMLPTNPLFGDDERIDCHGFMRAARQVGGDFYDAIQLDRHRYLIAIGDVCNKGMPAALFMAQSLTLLRSLAMRGRDDADVFMAALAREGNDHLCRMNSEQLFVSLFVAVLDVRSHDLRYVNAGHNPPLLLEPDCDPRLIDSPRNPVAGMVPGLQFRSGRVSFKSGATLLLYTDGVTEAEAGDGSQLGEEVLLALVKPPASSAAELIERIVHRVDVFSAGHPQADDITLIALRYRHAT
jgi:serine phosphatase RsbU (regulator of sigma subunit)/anti-sigma regulatory factor (Ser/Thr protein kinase)